MKDAELLLERFDPGREAFLARAPGRLDVMGGIADYSGSLVLQLPTAEATFAAVQRQDEPEVAIESLSEEPRRFRARLEGELVRPGGAVPFTRELCSGEDAWAAYILGCLALLVDRRGLELDGGLCILIRSDVPEAKGLSSSAALEVSTMLALCAALDIELEPAELARLCQRVEHEAVGAPCGIMDQMAVALGRERHLLALRCQPAEVLGHVPLPPELAVWGIDSGVRHSVAGEDYGSVRTAAFMGYRIMTALAGMEARELAPGKVAVEDTRWRGHVVNVHPREFRLDFLPKLPERMTGADFLERYTGITDEVTAVDPARTYRVMAATAHPVLEHQRCHLFADRLTGELGEERLQLLGSLMNQSHAGYTSCGLGCEATDRIHELVREAGPAEGLCGARITGGGSGGTVAILGRASAEGVVYEIAERLSGETGSEHAVFAGSSEGALASGVARWPT